MTQDNKTLVEKLKAVRDALDYIVDREDFSFAECTEAEMIWEKAKDALTIIDELIDQQSKGVDERVNSLLIRIKNLRETIWKNGADYSGEHIRPLIKEASDILTKVKAQPKAPSVSEEELVSIVAMAMHKGENEAIRLSEDDGVEFGELSYCDLSKIAIRALSERGVIKVGE